MPLLSLSLGVWVGSENVPYSNEFLSDPAGLRHHENHCFTVKAAMFIKYLIIKAFYTTINSYRPSENQYDYLPFA